MFGDDAGEPCNGDTSPSDCMQAWRWNLDYVVDTHHNAMSYWYTEEANSYGKNGTTTAVGTGTTVAATSTRSTTASATAPL